ncbi:MAG: hypothetical protein MZV64_32695 [Ignavibacteriales bacterium]|nr:hypothetical protein [Ignavibacteriales bacterium]
MDKTFYASSGDQNNGEILTIDPTNGAGTLLGPSSFDGVKSISIHPETGAIYGLVPRIIDADIIKVNAGGGDSHLLFTWICSRWREFHSIHRVSCMEYREVE